MDDAAAITLGDYADAWLQRQRHRLKRRTLETYAAQLRDHLLPALGPGTPLLALTPALCREALTAKLEAGYAGSTVRLMLAVLRALLTSARLDDHLIVTNPVERMGRLLPPRRKGPLPGKAMTKPELEALLAAARAHHPPLFPLVLVAARTGLRIGELLGLRWRDVDLAGRRLVVREALDSRRRPDTPKSGKGRTVGLSPETTRVLHGLFEVHGRPSRSAHVFRGPSGRPWSRVHVWRVLQRLSAEAALTPKSAHALRMTFGTQLAADGVRLTTIRDLLGHSSVTITEGYVDVAPDLRAVDALDRRR